MKRPKLLTVGDVRVVVEKPGDVKRVTVGNVYYLADGWYANGNTRPRVPVRVTDVGTLIRCVYIGEESEFIHLRECHLYGESE